MSLTPTQLLQRTEDRGSGGLGFLGCAENEVFARQIAEWLAANGNSWYKPFKLEDVGASDSFLWHRHSYPRADGNDVDLLCNPLRYLCRWAKEDSTWTVTKRFIHGVGA